MSATSSSATVKHIRTLTLRGRKWRVRWLDRVFDQFGEREVYGLCDHAASTISISLNQPLSEVADTFLHEILHALFAKAKERRIRSGATELLAALQHAGLCSKGTRHETGNCPETPTAVEE